MNILNIIVVFNTFVCTRICRLNVNRVPQSDKICSKLFHQKPRISLVKSTDILRTTGGSLLVVSKGNVFGSNGKLYQFVINKYITIVCVFFFYLDQSFVFMKSKKFYSRKSDVARTQNAGIYTISIKTLINTNYRNYSFSLAVKHKFKWTLWLIFVHFCPSKQIIHT